MSTQIEWVKNPDNTTRGITLNSKTGCQNHTPEGLCLGGLFPCYAWKLAHGRLKSRYLANRNIAKLSFPQGGEYGVGHLSTALADPFYPRFWPERLEQPYRIKKPVGIFLDDMSDWMGDYWPEEWTRAELQMMRDNPQHRIYTLTKQPQNLPPWSPFPENCWVGVTCTNQNNDILSNSLRSLIDVDAKVKFLSFEPLLGEINVSFYPDEIQWLIIGACTGTLEDIKRANYNHKDTDGLMPMPWGKKWTLQPRIEWVREIVKAANKAGVLVFLKDNLRPLLIPEDSSKPNYLMDDIFWASEKAQLRQEMPEAR